MIKATCRSLQATNHSDETGSLESQAQHNPFVHEDYLEPDGLGPVSLVAVRLRFHVGLPSGLRNLPRKTVHLESRKVRVLSYKGFCRAIIELKEINMNLRVVNVGRLLG